MSQICLYLDEDTIQKGLVQALRNALVDVITVAEVDRLSYSDEEQLTWASTQGRVIYTFNIQDFWRLHNFYIANNQSHAGIILGTQQQYSIGQQLRGLLKLRDIKSADEMIDQIEYLGNYIVRA